MLLWRALLYCCSTCTQQLCAVRLSAPHITQYNICLTATLSADVAADVAG